MIDARCLPSQTTTWLTPKWLIDSFHPFDLDPCCPPDMPWRTAEKMIHYPEDGLTAAWHGNVWLNPPYGREIAAWMEKLSLHGHGIALIFARTDARWFQEYVLGRADALFFLSRRVRFCLPDGTRGGSPAASSVLAFYGRENLECNPVKPLDGTMVRRYSPL